MLKDTWVDNDRKREGDNLTTLLEVANKEDKQLVEKHFLTMICHEDVWTGVDIADNTENVLMRGLKIAEDHPSLFQLQYSLISTGLKNQREFSPAQVPRHCKTYAPRTHYRIVFKEIGVTIDSMRSLPGVMKVLTETVSGVFRYCTVHV